MEKPDGRTRKPRTALKSDDERMAAAKRFAHELIRRRLNKGYRFGIEISKAAGVSRSYWSSLERGCRPGDNRPVFASPEILSNISKALDWSLSEIYETLGQLEPSGAESPKSVLELPDHALREEFAKLSQDERLRLLRLLVNVIAPEDAALADRKRKGGTKGTGVE